MKKKNNEFTELFNEEKLKVFEGRKAETKKIVDIRKAISQSKSIALDIRKAILPSLSSLDQISIGVAITKIDLGFSELGLYIKDNLRVDSEILVAKFLNDYLEKENQSEVFSELLQYIVKTLLATYVSDDVIEITETFKQFLKDDGFKEGSKKNSFSVEDKTLGKGFFEDPKEFSDLFADFVKFKKEHDYPYSRVINNKADISATKDKLSFIPEELEEKRYFDSHKNEIKKYENLNFYQKIDWLRHTLGLQIEEIEKLEEETIHKPFAIMHLSGVRIIFGHILSNFK